MTAYTRESPFDYGGIGYYLNRDREALVVNTFGAESITDMRASDADAIHALVTAERDTWAWTKNDRSEARKGRWAVGPEYRGDLVWVKHDDFPTLKWTKGWSGGDFWRFADAVRDDFLTWAATQTPPPPAWHKPEPGSLWELTVDGHTGDWVAVAGSGINVMFRRINPFGSLIPASSCITAGREVTR